MTTLQQFQNKFKVQELKIYETNYWIWSLRPHQATLGAGILSLKRACSSFSGLEPEEFCDLKIIVGVIEPSLQMAFNYDAINYLMLMMVDKLVHFHVLPRYMKPVSLFGRVWIDQRWPGVPDLAGEPMLENMEEMCSLIKSFINK